MAKPKDSTDPRATAARKKHEAAKRRAEYSHCEMLEVYGIVLKEHGFDPENVVIPGSWDCEKSPVGKCVYDFYQDPCRDSCLFCHDPEERK